MAALAVHALGGAIAAFRCLIYDAACLLPRQPVTWVLGVGLPRLVAPQLPHPALRDAIGTFADADVTPALLAATYAALLITGGFTRSVLWGTACRRFLSVMLFVLGPAVWLQRTAMVQLTLDEATQGVCDVFGNETLLPSSGTPTFSSWQAHLGNGLGGLPVAMPNLTRTYKEFAQGAAATECLQGDILMTALGPEHAFWTNRLKMQAGKLELDVFQPRAALPAQLDKGQGAPVVVFVHGGGWAKGDRSALSINYRGGMPGRLLDQGYMIVGVTYRLLCTGASLGDMVEDVRDALSYIAANSQAWGGDGSRVVLWGTSAGGHLALTTAYAKQAPQQVVGVVSYYGVTELREDALWEGAGSSWLGLAHAYFFISATAKMCPGDDCRRAYSPTVLASSASPPTLIVHGSHDPIVTVGQSASLQRRLEHFGVPHALVEVPCATHDCDVLCSSPCSQAGLFAMERFLYKVFFGA